MQIDAGISRVNVVTFLARRRGPSRNERAWRGSEEAPEFLRAVLSRSERLSGADPSQDAGAG